jgi:hypothetical protein
VAAFWVLIIRLKSDHGEIALDLCLEIFTGPLCRRYYLSLLLGTFKPFGVERREENSHASDPMAHFHFTESQPYASPYY